MTRKKKKIGEVSSQVAKEYVAHALIVGFKPYWVNDLCHNAYDRESCDRLLDSKRMEFIQTMVLFRQLCCGVSLPRANGT